MALTDDAKAEIAEAIRIIREDRFEKFVREHSVRNTPQPKVEEVLQEEETGKDGPTPPPAKETEAEKETDAPPKQHSRYWGEIFD